MTTMYQSVDDPEEREQEVSAERARARRRLWVWLAIGAALLALAAVFSVNRQSPLPETETATRAERASYHTAISETEIDLRRARLRDFETTYPKSELLPAVRAQLSVLDAHETKAWAALTDVMFEPSAERLTKLGAIQVYEQQWGSSYLGGRDSDIRALREELELDPEPIPDRELTGGKSPIPITVPDNVMVGGPRRAPPPAPVRPPAPVQKRAVNTPVITAPKITRNVTPRYPRRAQRRGINAVVELSLSIDAEGEVQMVEVLRVEAERYKKQFVKAAERAALKTRYSPQTVGGRAVPAQGIKKRYVFKMD